MVGKTREQIGTLEDRLVLVVRLTILARQFLCTDHLRGALCSVSMFDSIGVAVTFLCA